VTAFEPFLLLTARLGPAGDLAAAFDSWREGDVELAASLLHGAYPPDIGRHFAPNGTPAEWLRYVTALVTQGPCGMFSPVLTRVAREGATMRGLAMMTLASPAVAHLAQLAVRSDARQQGLGSALVRAAAASAAAAGCERLTLLVAPSNTPARRLYASLGFTE
jgi:GNAT superfamily N-acetyltransferase